MENNKIPLFTIRIIAIILGVTLFRQFDFQNFKFEKPGLAIVYLIVFAGSIYLLIKNAKSK